MKLEKADLFSISDIRHEFLIGKSQRTKYKEILVIKYSGEYGFGSRGNPDARFMCALAEAAISYYDPDGIVLDISELKYEWGDMLEMVFSLGAKYYRHTAKDKADQESKALYEMRAIPQATLIGPPCKEAVRTLLLGEDCDTSASLKEYAWLFENFDDAWNYVEEQIALDSLSRSK
jgi:hypothetical protein